MNAIVSRAEQLDGRLRDALQSVRRRPRRPGEWVFRFPRDPDRIGIARMDAGGLTLDLDLSAAEMERFGVGAQNAWRSLCLQGDPRFAAKIVPAWTTGAGRLRREPGLSAGAPTAERIERAATDLTDALALLGEAPAESHPVAATPNLTAEERETLMAALAECGRPHRVDGRDRLRMELFTDRTCDRRVCRYTAVFAKTSGGPFVRVPLSELSDQDAARREAIGGVLLEVGRRVRGVRGTVRPVDTAGSSEVALEMANRTWSSASEARIEALTLACRECGPEIELLAAGDPAAARWMSPGAVRVAAP